MQFMGKELDKFLTPESFGRGTFMGDDPTIMDLSSEDRLRVSAWRQSCPMPGKVSGQYGLEWTRRRYDECDFVFKSIICETASRVNPELYNLLVSSTVRLPDEPVGYFEPGTVPESHFSEMSPLSTLWGYALPRVFIEIAGRGDGRTAERYFQAMDTVEKVAKVSKDPIELLARLSEAAYESGVDPKEILGHTLEPGILKEENCRTMYREVIAALREKAPRLWAYYESLSSGERGKAGILPNPI